MKKGIQARDKMAYKFKFEGLLSYRKHLKELAEVELSREQFKLRDNQDLLDNIKEDLQEAGRDLATGLRGTLSSDSIINYSEYISAQEIKITLQEIEILKHEAMVEEKRKALLEATKQFKIIEKLREKDSKKWKHKQLRREQQEMNETAIIRHGKEFL